MNPIAAIRQTGVIAVLRAASATQLTLVAEAMAAGGIKAIEVSMTTPDAIQVLIDGRQAAGRDVAFGAGTVLDYGTALRVLDAGADFLLSPAYDPRVMELCVQRQIPYIPGCLTPTEIVNANVAGAAMIKLFPAAIGGPGLVRALLAPLPHVELIAVGGVDSRNAGEYIAAGAVAVGVGSSLFKDGPGRVDFEAVSRASSDLLAAVHRGRAELLKARHV